MGYKWEEREVTIRRKGIVSVTCDECGEHIDFDQEHDQWATAKKALGLELQGGYYSYFDHLGERPFVLLCEACADRLVEAFPSMKRAIEAAL